MSYFTSVGLFGEQFLDFFVQTVVRDHVVNIKIVSVVTDRLCHRVVHALVVIGVVLHVLAHRWVLGIHSAGIILAFSLDCDVKLGKSRQESGDVLVCLAQFILIVGVF